VPTRLYAVAALPPPRLAARVEALRRVLGDPRRHDLPAHLTLVPPIPLDDDGALAARRTLRAIAEAHRIIELRLGPATTFAPSTPTLHLSLEGDVAALTALAATLRGRDPFVRPTVHDFVPHVTLLQQADEASIEAGTTVLTGSLGSWTLDGLHLLERLRPDAGSIWHPVGEEPLGGPHVVGRGGIELHLRGVRTLEPAAAAVLGRWPGPDEPLATGGDLLVVVAELPGAPGSCAGVAIGRADGAVAVLEQVVVEPAQRCQGIARQVVQHWCWLAAARRGADTVLVEADQDDGLLSALGFERAGRRWCRALDTASG
jgi:2'-5' RNA ligase/GNAT superfamily N-acetyltransferase